MSFCSKNTAHLHRVCASIVSLGILLAMVLAPITGRAATVRDEFNAVSFAGNDGTANWSNNWQELGEGNGPGTGRVRIQNNTRCVNNPCLRIGINNNDINGRGVSRQADLSAATSATLNFSYRRRDTGDPNTASVDVDVWDDNTLSWVTLQTYQLNADDGSDVPQSFDISAYMFVNSQIRFIGTGDPTWGRIFIDNVEINYFLDANLLVLKSSSTVRDPLGGTTPNAFSIPSAVVEYAVSISNSGAEAAEDVFVTDTLDANLAFLAGEYNGGASDIEITVGAAAPVYCIAEVGGDSNADGCFLNGAGDFLTVSIPVSGGYPTGLTIGTTAPNDVATVRFRTTVN